jgi:microcystin-dependent protein
MTEPYLSEIRIMSFNYAPRGWSLCNGSLLPINQNQALFSVIGTRYGGNGMTNFALPDMRGRVPTHRGGEGHFLGEVGGVTTVTLSIPQMPLHNHVAQGASVDGDIARPLDNLLAATPALIYEAPGKPTTLQPDTVTYAGGSQPHDNMQPYLVLNFSIALQGSFPPPN